uniref:Ig-like domain-containing protein n=1 Tax=Oryzias latipes TaxID=8090 RepID=A0A3B3HR02_ORYLA
VSWVRSLVSSFFSLCLASDCDDDGIVAHVGQDVTLRCGYNISTNGEIPVCWGRDAQYILGCRNELLATDGSRVKEERRASCRYQMLGHLNKGDVSLTIRNVTEEDSGLYACRVEIPGMFNDELYYMDLSVINHSYPVSLPINTMIEQFVSSSNTTCLAALPPCLLHTQYIYLPSLHHVCQLSAFPCHCANVKSPYSQTYVPAFSLLSLATDPSASPLSSTNSSQISTDTL